MSRFTPTCHAFHACTLSMTDLTALFHQCVDIVLDELVVDKKQSHSRGVASTADVSLYTIADSFNKEAYEFNISINTLHRFLDEIKSAYLAMSDDSIPGVSNALSIQDKNEIDEEFHSQIQQMYGKLKALQSYEAKRQELSHFKPKPKSGWFGSILGDDEPSSREVFAATINTHRTQVLRYLNYQLNETSKAFEKLLKRRHQRERQLMSLNFENIDDNESEDLNLLYDPLTNDDAEDDWGAKDDFESGESIPMHTNSYSQQLTQEQVQQFEQENQDFLSLKTNQLEQVERLQTSMLDIVNIQSELSFQLESQGDQIGNLMDSHLQVEIDVKMGNKQLGKALVRNKKGANMLVTLGFVLGFLLLTIDYLLF